MARRSSVLPSEMLANRAVIGVQGGDHGGPGVQAPKSGLVEVESVGVLMD